MGVDTCRTWPVYPNSGLKQVDFSSPTTSLYVPCLSPTYSELLSFAFGNQNVTEALPRWRHRQTFSVLSWQKVGCIATARYVQYRCINPLGSPEKVNSQLQVFPAYVVGLCRFGPFGVGPEFNLISRTSSLNMPCRNQSRTPRGRTRIKSSVEVSPLLASFPAPPFAYKNTGMRSTCITVSHPSSRVTYSYYARVMRMVLLSHAAYPHICNVTSQKFIAARRRCIRIVLHKYSVSRGRNQFT